MSDKPNSAMPDRVSDLIRNNEIDYKRKSVRLRLANTVQALEKKLAESEYQNTLLAQRILDESKD